MNATHKAALAWLANRVAVIPITYKTKTPMVPWHDYRDRLPSMSIVDQWFRTGKKNLGVICGGPSNLVIIDFDDINYYYEWRKDMMRREDVWHDVALNTYRVRTPRGIHLYVRTDKPELSYKDRTHNLDVRSGGNYTLVPPSIHPSGSKYVAIGSVDKIVTVSNLKEVIPGDFVNIRETSHLRNENVDWFENVERLNINIIKERFDILEFVSRYRPVKRGVDGVHWTCRCIHPGHKDRHPSFMINTQTQRAWCMSGRCQLCAPPTHDVIDLYAVTHNLTNGQAIQEMMI